MYVRSSENRDVHAHTHTTLGLCGPMYGPPPRALRAYPCGGGDGVPGPPQAPFLFFRAIFTCFHGNSAYEREDPQRSERSGVKLQSPARRVLAVPQLAQISRLTHL